ncbi:MAG: hypothetical protein RLY43_974 [Bacteroidota bacterium]
MKKTLLVIFLVFSLNVWSQQNLSILSGTKLTRGLGYENPGYVVSVQNELWKGKVFSEINYNTANKYTGRGYVVGASSQFRHKIKKDYFVGGGFYYSQTITDWIKTSIAPLLSVGNRKFWVEYHFPDNTINSTQDVVIRMRIWRIQPEFSILSFIQSGQRHWGYYEKISFILFEWGQNN